MNTPHHAGNGRGKHVTEKHVALHDFIGEWNVAQKIWSAPGAEPVHNRGRTTCTALLDGKATLMVTEMHTSDYRGVSLITYDAEKGRYTLAYVDTLSSHGVKLMNGQENGGVRLMSERGQNATQVRDWSTGIRLGRSGGGEVGIQSHEFGESDCVPASDSMMLNSFAAAQEGGVATLHSAPPAPPESGEIPLRLVENKVSDDEWVLEFFMPGPDGNEFLVQENTFTRIGRGRS